MGWFDRTLFRKGDFRENTAVLTNPDRGFFQLFSVNVGEQPDYELFERCLIDTESLVLLVLDIGKYRECLIPAEALTAMTEVVRFFANHQKDVIVRVVYDHEGRAAEREPDTFEQVQKHCEQIADWILAQESKIFIAQGLLIGNWGEMHSSRYLGKGQIRTLAQILGDRLNGECFLAVRKPVDYRIIRPNFPVLAGEKRTGIGLFNDAILASENDMGTYGEAPNYMWEKSWKREEELEFQNRLCKCVPNGGEAVYGDGFGAKMSPERTIETLRKMHLGYLNRLYDRKLLGQWEHQICGERGAWLGKSLYRYIEAHLGYRLLVRDIVSDKEDGKDGTVVCLKILMENTGFAGCYREVVFTLKDEKGMNLCELGSVKADTLGTFEFTIKLKLDKKRDSKQELFLQAFRKCDGRVVHLANKEQNDSVYLGRIAGYTINEVIS